MCQCIPDARDVEEEMKDISLLMELTFRKKLMNAGKLLCIYMHML